MKPEAEFWEAIKQIRLRDDSYQPELYSFVMESLDFTIRTAGERRHVSASELIDGMCTFAKDRFGLLAHTVLQGWGVRTTADIGKAVYQLVDAELLAKQETDQPTDFNIDCDLVEVLEDKYFD